LNINVSQFKIVSFYHPSVLILADDTGYLGYPHCMAIKRRPYTNVNSYYYDWIDDDCYQKKFYICERPSWCCWDRSCLRKLDASKVVFKKYFLSAGAVKEKPFPGTPR